MTHFQQQPIVRAHLVRHTVHEDVFYPAHPPREETDEYRAIRHKLIVEEDKPCFICGIRNSQLADKKTNPYGVKEMEVHHLWVEWALTDAVDVKRLEAFFHEAISDVAAWVDHSPHQCLVLCDIHHRHKEAGIHELSFPIWVAQKFVRQDYSLIREGKPS